MVIGVVLFACLVCCVIPINVCWLGFMNILDIAIVTYAKHVFGLAF